MNSVTVLNGTKTGLGTPVQDVGAGRQAAAPVATHGIVRRRQIFVRKAIGLGITHVSCTLEPSPNRRAGRPCRQPHGDGHF